MIFKEKQSLAFDDIIDELVIETGLSKVEVQKIYRSMTDTIEEAMKNKEEVIKIDKVGKFNFQKKKFDKVSEFKEKKIQRSKNE